MVCSQAPLDGGARRRARENLAATVVIWVVASLFLEPLIRSWASGVDSPSHFFGRMVVTFTVSVVPVLLGWLTRREYGLALPVGGWARTFRVTLLCLAAAIVPMLTFVIFLPPSHAPVDLVRAAIMSGLVKLVFSSSGEEFFFRGALQPLVNQSWPGKLGTARLSFHRGTVLVAVTFGLVHLMGPAPLQWKAGQVVFATMFGLAAGYAKDELQTVWVPVFMHIVINWFFFLFSLVRMG